MPGFTRSKRLDDAYVRTDTCDGCKGQDKAACMYICPHDLMKLDDDGSATGNAMKAYNQEPEQCWECFACVKICPRNAIEVRHYADVVPLGASVQPLRGSDSITWNITFRNGTTKRFEFPIRTTPEGSADPYGAHGDAALNEITDHSTLFTKGTHSCDLDSFREFIESPGFRAMFDLGEEERRRLNSDEEALLGFSMRFLKQVLFGEMTIPVKENARARRIAERRDVWGRRRNEEAARHREAGEDPRYE